MRLGKKQLLFMHEKKALPYSLISERLKFRLDAALVCQKAFGETSISWSPDGYFYLSRMPPEKDLNAYYSTIYWEARGGKDLLVSSRDREHFLFLLEHAAEALEPERKVLNFGAGHGGSSHLFWARGMRVTNIEPSDIPHSYKERWEQLASIDQVQDVEKFDLIYGSHSLEHVSNLPLLYDYIKRILKKGGYIFWEVPNGNNPSNGGCNGQVFVPHTYYFTRQFFRESADFEVVKNILIDDLRVHTDDEAKANAIVYLGRRK